MGERHYKYTLLQATGLALAATGLGAVLQPTASCQSRLASSIPLIVGLYLVTASLDHWWPFVSAKVCLEETPAHLYSHGAAFDAGILVINRGKVPAEFRAEVAALSMQPVKWGGECQPYPMQNETLSWDDRTQRVKRLLMPNMRYRLNIVDYFPACRRFSIVIPASDRDRENGLRLIAVAQDGKTEFRLVIHNVTDGTCQAFRMEIRICPDEDPPIVVAYTRELSQRDRKKPPQSGC